MNVSDSILLHHLTRRAIVYVRQSTPQQVINHQESLRLQYALRQRAQELGWPESRVEVIDTDLGQSAASTDGRVGFHELVTQVALGQVGILIAYDATRLARNCSHWYQLLDLCGRTDCLIADRDGVYDPATVNGRLLLGLKGQISELELHTIRARLTAGMMNKARRGELALLLPTGLVRSPTGQVVLNPDREVQDRLRLIFQMMLEKKAIARVVRLFREKSLRVPRQDRYGDIQWRTPNAAMLSAILTNPAYAGAFVYGRTRTLPDDAQGKCRRKQVPANEWKVCLHDKYPAYISWETFEKINAMLHDNHSEYQRRQSRGIPRDGHALLQGIVYCGECGHKMTVTYKSWPRYTCPFLRNRGQGVGCPCAPAAPLDQQVLTWFWEALSVAEIDLSARILRDADRQRDALGAAQRQQVERLRHEAHLAERQYRHSDPENRLVTAELERRWEAALRAVQEAEELLEVQQRSTTCWAIPADLLEILQNIGPRLHDLWHEELLSWSQKKSLLRCLVEKVVVRRHDDYLETRVVWRGGESTCQNIPVTVHRFQQLAEAADMESLIVSLAKSGKTDEQIAEQLTSQGYRSPRKPTVIPSTVARIRLQHEVLSHGSQSHPRRVPGFLTVTQLARQLNVAPHWIYDRIRMGTIKVAKDANTKGYLFPDKPETVNEFKQLLAGERSQLAY